MTGSLGNILKHNIYLEILILISPQKQIPKAVQPLQQRQYQETRTELLKSLSLIVVAK